MSGDNGATWTQLSLSPDVLPLNGISCTSALICDAVGGSVISTSDGGQTWASVADPGEFVFSVDCVSSTCLAVGSNQVLEGPA
jgi:photosystem II stability/assembly factor-like uncharacterized protein